ncbi:hypothetical protein Tco_1554188 [Tanacetum coccineum]
MAVGRSCNSRDGCALVVAWGSGFGSVLRWEVAVWFLNQSLDFELLECGFQSLHYIAVSIELYQSDKVLSICNTYEVAPMLVLMLYTQELSTGAAGIFSHRRTGTTRAPLEQ